MIGIPDGFSGLTFSLPSREPKFRSFRTKLSGLGDNCLMIPPGLRTETLKASGLASGLCKCLNTGSLLLLDDGVLLPVGGVLLGVVGPVVGV